MSHWKDKIEQKWPGMKVIGKLADQPGYFLKITCNAMDTYQLGTLQETLLKLGCTGWNWKHEGNCVTVRAYAPQHSPLQAMLCRTGVALVVIALAVSVLYLVYDVRVAEIIGFESNLHK